MSAMFVRENGIDWERVRALKIRQTLGPYPVRYRYADGARREGMVTVVRCSSGRLGLELAGPLGGNDDLAAGGASGWVVRVGVRNSGQTLEQLMSEQFYAVGEFDVSETVRARAYLALVDLMPHVEGLDTLTSMVAYGISSGAIRT